MTHLTVGDSAPHFTVTDQSGATHSLADYSGKKLIIYFYPKDNTPGCTQQACNLRDNYNALQEKGYSILGVSMDSATSHQKFITKFSLPFPLIVDEQRELITAFGVWGEKKFMGKIYDGIHRTTFVIDEQGKIEHIIDKPKTKVHGVELLEI